jgi:hypothetical protein
MNTELLAIQHRSNFGKQMALFVVINKQFSGAIIVFVTN